MTHQSINTLIKLHYTELTMTNDNGKNMS